MPYKTVADLPDAVRAHLPAAAQAIYLEVFNSAWDQYAARETANAPSLARGPRLDPIGDDREVLAHKVAWTAVKKQYQKRGDRWAKISLR